MAEKEDGTMTREQIEALKALAMAAGRHPWKVDISENAGDNWLVASFGADHDGKDYIVTTDYVRASEYDSDGSRAEATHVAAWSPANVLKFLEAFEAMEAENKALREALEPLIEIGNRRCCDAPEWRTDDMVWTMIYIADLRRARKALGAE